MKLDHWIRLNAESEHNFGLILFIIINNNEMTRNFQ